MPAMKATRLLRRARCLIVGCGDVGLRAVRLMAAQAAGTRIVALTSQPERMEQLRAAGVVPMLGDLDARRTLRRLNGLAPTVLHLAPPPSSGGETDPRTQALIAALSAPARLRAARAACAAPTARLRRMHAHLPYSPLRQTSIVPDALAVPRAAVRLVYASTTGVYGDCGGALIDETRPVNPTNARAKRRVDAERQLRQVTARGALRASIVRIPGIYAAERLPLARIARHMPALHDADDVYTNHIHADDLAAILLRTLRCGAPARVFHASDDSVLKMGAYFDLVARAYGLTPVPRISRSEAERQLEPLTLSFMSESRRLANSRLKRELRVALRYARVEDFLATVRVT